MKRKHLLFKEAVCKNRIYKDTYSIFYVCIQTLCFRVVDIAKEGMPRLLNFHIIWKIFNCNKDTNEVA